MAIDLFSPAVLNRIVQDLKGQVRSFFLDTYFPETATSDQDEIYFDVLTNKTRLAPFVIPTVEGQLVQSRGYVTKSFKPAYIKDKRVFEDGKPLKRAAGQPTGQPLDPMAVRQALVAQESADQLDMHARRLEWMASEILRTGSVTITGEKYPTTVVNFGRDASLTVVQTGTALWTDTTNSDPLNDLETYSSLIADASGADARHVTMASDVWTAFRKHPKVTALMGGTFQRTDVTVVPTPAAAPQIFGARPKGMIGEFEIWVHSDTYTNEAGSTVKYLPNNYLIMGAPAQAEGVRFFGRIQDEQSGYQVTDYYQKSWIMPDPSVRFLMLQSAPLLVPYRINATLSAKVV
jgi:hypothetical protein